MTRFRLTLGIVFGFCLVLAVASPANGQAGTNQTGVIRVACLGDSLTYQEYPQPLNKLLGPGYLVEDFGTPSATAEKHGDLSYWNTGQIQKAIKFAPQIVTILLGSNDSRSENNGHQGEFFEDYKALIETVRNFPSKPKIYIMIPPLVFGVGAYNLNSKVLREIITPAIEKAAKDAGCPTIDLYTPLTNSPQFSTDNVHFSPAGDAVMAKQIYDALKGKP